MAPRLALVEPRAEIVVAGRAPSRKLAELLGAAPNLRLAADPPDVAPLLAEADLMLVPLFKGTWVPGLIDYAPSATEFALLAMSAFLAYAIYAYGADRFRLGAAR